MSDNLIIGLNNEQTIRIYAVKTTDIMNQAVKYHDLYPTSAAALGRTLSATCMMAAMLKDSDSKIISEIKGDGPIGTIFVEAKANGDVKGFVGNHEVYEKYDNGKLAVGYGVGNGTLKVTKIMGMKHDFSGVVELQSGEIGDDFAYYFMTSEQTPSVVSVGVLVDVDYSILASGGLIIQLLPNHTEEDIVFVENILKVIKPISTSLNEGLTCEEIVQLYFSDATILEKRSVQWKCDCSRDRFKAALTTLPMSDLYEMINDDGKCDITCQFCKNEVSFSKSDLESIVEFKKSCGL